MGKNNNIKRNKKKAVPSALVQARWVDNGLPTFMANVNIDHVFRFQFVGGVTVAVTWQRLGELLVLALSTTTTAVLFNRVKICGVRMFGTAEPCTLSLNWSGSNSGNVGNQRNYSDSSIGTAFIAKIPKGPSDNWLKPRITEQVGQWQVCTSANNSTAFIVSSSSSGSIMDVHVVYTMPSLVGDNNNNGPAVGGVVAGDLIFLGLDGALSSGSQLRPIGPTAIA